MYRLQILLQCILGYISNREVLMLPRRSVIWLCVAVLSAELDLFFELCKEGIPGSDTLERWRLTF